MAMDRKNTVIDGVQYSVATLDGYSALPVWHKIATVLVPAFNAISASGAALATVTKEASLSELAVLGKVAMVAGEAALKNMNPVDLRYCIDQFADATTITLGGKTPKLPTVYADHFAGNLVNMWRWFYFCVEVNFGDFSDLARKMLSSARDKKNASDEGNAATDTQTSASPAASTP